MKLRTIFLGVLLAFPFVQSANASEISDLTVVDIMLYEDGSSYIRFDQNVDSTNGGCNKNLAAFNSAGPNGEGFTRLATAALLSGKQVTVKTASNCESGNPKIYMININN